MKQSRIKTVYILARRGPAQAACTIPELKELGELENAAIVTHADELILDDASREMAEKDGQTRRKLNMLENYSTNTNGTGKERKIVFRFLVSPLELIDDGAGGVQTIRLAKNKLVAQEDGRIRPIQTGAVEDMQAGMVFRSIGYRGVPIAGLPFDERYGIIKNTMGRVTDDGGSARVGEYTAGWIKRGPSGIVGTNKPDALETVKRMVEDVRAGVYLTPSAPAIEAAKALVAERQPNYFSYADWEKLDALETERGQALGCPRVKFTQIDAMVAAVKG